MNAKPLVHAAALLLLLVGLVVAPAPAQAAPRYPWWPKIEYPLYRHDGDTGKHDVAVQIAPGSHGWGILRAAREFDAELPQVRIHTDGCAAHPEASCVTVHETFDDQPGARHGWCYIHEPADRDIYLNTRLPKSRAVAAHELGHALGLGHHRSPGVTTEGYSGHSAHLAPAERTVLRIWFANH